MRILGIDPGSTLIGYGLLEKDSKGLSVLDYGVLTIKAKDPLTKIQEISTVFPGLLKKWKPDIVGLEKVFFSKNKKTALEVAQARGALSLLILQNKVSVFEFTPGEVKLAVTGYGSADKQSVIKMVSQILSISGLKEDNTADALAIALASEQAFQKREKGLD
ncbi:MAG: crossover junction endodeoxyribonuclease RuvC [Candidatus Harrisonbacteria bacterium]|nr:crossover junction endodeoxyribonuclease RuvC [Candidatus Harrisonbacteria bacterium]